jgi:hypothetical protein
MLKMSTKVISELHDDYLLLTGSGSISTIDEYESLTEQYVTEALKFDEKTIILDETSLQFAPSLLLQSDVVQLYVNFPDEIAESKVAVVSNKESIVFQKYWEYSANKAGYNYKVFSSMDEALEFIKE